MYAGVSVALVACLVAASNPVLGTPAPNPGNAWNPHHPARQMFKRAITDDVTQVNGKSFDFVIAGGGLAGLALAGRLSEYANQTVLVIEAGLSGDAVADRIDVPGYSYLQALSNTEYDWQYRTVTQQQAGGESKAWPRGKVLGGSGAINGLFWGRGDAEVYDAWATLNPNTNQTWNWNEVNKYIKKSENYVAPRKDQIDQFHMPVNVSAHGQGGPIQAGHSQSIYPVTENWVPSWQALNFPAHDLADGSTRGVMICPSTMWAANQSRCDSRAGYIDPLPPRDNLVILTGQQVTEVLFNGTKDAAGDIVASGVSFQASAGAQGYTVQANKEVILSGGTVGSPQILQLSGIGPKNVLDTVGIQTKVDLPVGHNLQDHASFTMYFDTTNISNWFQLAVDQGAQAAAFSEWENSKTGLLTYINEAVGYISGADLFGGAAGAQSAANGVDIGATISALSQAHNIPASLQAGLQEQFNIQKQYLVSNVGQVEVILTTYGKAANNIGIQIAMQIPFSRGTIFVNSKSAFDAPTIDPSYFSINMDAQILTGAANWVRNTLSKAAPLSNVITSETLPGTGVTGDALSAYATKNAGTEYHPLGTCSMLPRDKGGVVDTDLKVYGTSNIRVVDSSIMPLQISAHLMATTYGIAEKAADMIKVKHQYVPPVNNTSVAPVATTAKPGNATDTSVTDHDQDHAGSRLSTGAKLGLGIGLGVGIPLALAALALLFVAMRKNKGKHMAADQKGWYTQGASHDNGAWDVAQANSEQQLMPPRFPDSRPMSQSGSLSTMATSELAGNGYADGFTPSQSGFNTPQGYPNNYRD